MGASAEIAGTARAVAEIAARALELFGIALLCGGVLYSSAAAAKRALGRARDVYPRYRRELARAILLGLEVLVAGDIVATISVSPTLTSVAVLAVIVAIRTFLSFSLEVEVEGRWPWQEERRPAAPR